MCKNIIILDDHPLIIEGIKLMLDKYEEFEIIEAFNDIDQLLNSDKIDEADIIILDLNVKGRNSLENFHDIKSLYKESKFIAFTSYDTPSIKEECQSLGLEGYILKDTTKKEFINCLSTVLEGEVFYQTEKKKPQKYFIGEKLAINRISSVYKLSSREQRVFELLIQGDTEQKIADKLFLSKHTVHSHNKNLKRKLKVNNIIQMIKLVYSQQHL